MRIDRFKFTTLLMERELTQKELAEKAGISRASVSYIKCGKSCSETVGNAIAKALSVDVTEILENEKE